MNLPPLPQLPDQLRTDRDPTSDLLDVIKTSITNHPRSQQKRIGPSEIGQPCARRIGYQLTGHPETNTRTDDVPWKPTIGTYAHAGMEDVFTDANTDTQHARWLTEMTVSVGDIGGTDITGHADLYDRYTDTVIDWKFVGPTQLRKYKSKGPGPQYRDQIHLYGRGFARRGLPVKRVLIAFMPRDGEFRDAHLWTEPYDEQVALDALQRANGIHLTVTALGVDGLAALGTAEQYCTRCPFYRRGSTDLATGCPGDPEASAATTAGARDHFADLIAAG